jgi:hypothetical protein
VVGQGTVAVTLRNALREGRVAERVPVHRKPRHGQDVDGAHFFEGAQLPERRRRRTVR